MDWGVGAVIVLIANPPDSKDQMQTHDHTDCHESVQLTAK